MHPLQEMIQRRNNGAPCGVFSICSAYEYVIRAGMMRAKTAGQHVLIEATSNQVNQYGGYIGMQPSDFVDFVNEIAEVVGFPKKKILLGGDHLGPMPWPQNNEADAMEKAKVLVRDYVRAGFSKIHLDTSMKLFDDDPECPLSDEIIAKRGAELAVVCEETFKNEYLPDHPDALAPVYVLGSDIPVLDGPEASVTPEITSATAFRKTVKVYKEAFEKAGLDDAWTRVIGMVVQPGVEFSNDTVCEYNHTKALKLTSCLKDYPSIVFEGHSTDYQTKKALREMVEDGIAILKVGPAFTFAMREALFALAAIEKELYNDLPEEQSRFIEVLQEVMLNKPKNWQPYCHGTLSEVRMFRKFGYSDRIRYYMAEERVKNALNILIENLKKRTIPPMILSQFLPREYTRVRENVLQNDPEALIVEHIGHVMDEYLYAIRALQ